MVHSTADGLLPAGALICKFRGTVLPGTPLVDVSDIVTDWPKAENQTAAKNTGLGRI